MAKKRKDKTWLYGLGILVLIIILIVVIKMRAPAEAEEVPEEEEEVAEVAEEGTLVEKEEAPEEVERCDVETVFTFHHCDKLATGNIAVALINSGRGTIEGAWIYVVAEDGSIGYEEVRESIAVGEIKTYEIDMNKWINKLGSVEKVQIAPEDIVEGTLKVCANQKQHIVPKVNCR